MGGPTLAVGLHLMMEEVLSKQGWMRWTLPDADGEETRMDSNYVFLCGVMWCRFGQQDAGQELLRASDSRDPDMRAGCAIPSVVNADGFGSTIGV